MRLQSLPSVKELQTLLRVLQASPFEEWIVGHGSTIPPYSIAPDLAELNKTTGEKWFYSDKVGGDGYQWFFCDAKVGEPVVVFVLVVSEPTGIRPRRRQQRVAIAYTYTRPQMVRAAIRNLPTSWPGWSRPLGYYRDYHLEPDSCCGTGDCYCLKCTAAMIIQRNYLRWKHDQIYYLLILNFRVNFGQDVPQLTEKILTYYINL